MHAIVIDVEGCIYTIRYMFANDSLFGFILSVVMLGSIGVVVWAWGKQGFKWSALTRPRSTPASLSDTDPATQGRRTPLSSSAGFGYGGAHHFGNGGDCWPLVNTNGMPMIPRTGIDVTGQPYGSDS